MTHIGRTGTELGYKVGPRLREIVPCGGGSQAAGFTQLSARLKAHLCNCDLCPLLSPLPIGLCYRLPLFCLQGVSAEKNGGDGGGNNAAGGGSSLNVPSSSTSKRFVLSVLSLSLSLPLFDSTFS